MRRAKLVPVLLLATLSAAACGTTVPGAGQGQALGASGSADGLGGAGSTTDAHLDSGFSATTGSVAGGATAAGVTTGPGQLGTSGAGTSSGGQGTTGSGGSSAAAGPLGRGVTDRTVTIDVMASKTLGAQFAAFGAAGAAPPDPTPQIRALTDYLNARGGLKGKKVQVHFTWRDDSNSAQDFASQDQAMCADMTEDNKVFLVMTVYGGHGLVPCLSKVRTPLIEAGGGPPHYGVGAWDKAGGLYQTPNQMSFCRYARSLVDGLFAQGFFNGAKSIGLPYTADEYRKQAVDHCLLPAMSAHGLPKPAIVEYTPLERPSDYGRTQAQAANAVLQFKASGVTHVLFLDQQGTTFIDNAKSQNYRPRYGFGTMSSPYGMASYEGDELKGALGVGTVPALDMNPDDLRTPVSDKETLCRQIMVKAKLAEQVSDPFTWGIMRGHCEAFFFLMTVFQHAPEVSVDGFLQGAAAIGTGYTPVTTYGFRSGPHRFDGLAAGRPFAYVSDCTCIRYTGAPYAIP